MREFLLGFTAIVFYGGFHSVLAALNIKAWFVDIFGWRAYEGLYRLFFNGVAVITLLPVFGILIANPGKTIWEIGAPISYILLSLQAIGGIGLVISLLQIDTLRFLGLSQYAAWSNGKPLPLPDEALQTSGIYALVRHPLYFFSLLALWPSPIITTGTLGLLVGITLYFVFGSLLEEQKLQRVFGQPYVEYQKRVAWLIPLVKIRPQPAINVGDYLQE